MSRLRSRGTRLTAWAVVALLPLAGCTEPHPNLNDLKQTPGALTAYPGALVYQRAENEARNQVDGPAPASISVYACTPDPATSVQAWFDKSLTRNGWLKDPQGHQDRPGAFEGGASWKRGNAHFDLSFATPATTAELARKANKPTGCPTGFQTLAQIG